MTNPSTRRGAEGQRQGNTSVTLSNPAQSYGASTVKRLRRTKAELDELHEAIYRTCSEEHPITVRAIFYRVLSLGIIPKTEQAYRGVQREVLKMRRAHELPYRWVSDGSRIALRAEVYDDAEEALRDVTASYRRALWQDVDVHVEVWSEKDAISGTIHPITDRWQVPLLIARGYSSETFLWNSAEALMDIDKPAVIYQLGDHDPSGVNAWEDIQRKLREFTSMSDLEITFQRIAVTPDQIEELALSTRPTKVSDTRSSHFEGQSVEVDAIPPSILRELVEDAISSHIDPAIVEIHNRVEEEERRGLEALADGWTP